MKKILISLACAGMAAAGAVVTAPSAASAAGDCIVAKDSYTMTVKCYPGAPGTQYRIVASCPDGLRWSRWENQVPWYVNTSITMQCNGIQLHDIQYR